MIFDLLLKTKQEQQQNAFPFHSSSAPFYLWCKNTENKILLKTHLMEEENETKQRNGSSTAFPLTASCYPWFMFPPVIPRFLTNNIIIQHPPPSSSLRQYHCQYYHNHHHHLTSYHDPGQYCHQSLLFPVLFLSFW